MASVYKSISKANGEKSSKSSNSDTAPKNRQRVLILSSRGVTYRHRHLLNDLHSLLPHSRKDAKLDTKTKLYQLNELADLYNCNNVLFFEARKGKDLYIWISKPPNGPTVKLHMQNLHTMSELHFPGNCLKGSRPILSFDATFGTQPHLLLLKELLTHVFSVPRTSRRVKPFVDHVLGFTIADGKIWVRCFQINETEGDGVGEAHAEGTVLTAEDEEMPDVDRPAEDEANGRNGKHAKQSAKIAKPKGKKQRDPTISLVEIGPRFVMTPIVVLEGSFGGPVIYENRAFVSPNAVRAAQRMQRAGKFARRDEAGREGRARKHDLGLKTGAPRREREGDEVDDRVVFR